MMVDISFSTDNQSFFTSFFWNTLFNWVWAPLWASDAGWWHWESHSLRDDIFSEGDSQLTLTELHYLAPDVPGAAAGWAGHPHCHGGARGQEEEMGQL